MFYFYLDSYIALITLAIESSKDGKMTLNGKLSFTSLYFENNDAYVFFY